MVLIFIQILLHATKANRTYVLFFYKKYIILYFIRYKKKFNRANFQSFRIILIIACIVINQYHKIHLFFDPVSLNIISEKGGFT